MSKKSQAQGIKDSARHSSHRCYPQQRKHCSSAPLHSRPCTRSPHRRTITPTMTLTPVLISMWSVGRRRKFLSREQWLAPCCSICATGESPGSQQRHLVPFQRRASRRRRGQRHRLSSCFPHRATLGSIVLGLKRGNRTISSCRHTFPLQMRRR